MPSARRSRPIVVTEVGRSATGRDSRISFLVTYTGRSVPSSARQRLTALFLTCSRRFLIFTVSGAETAAACGCVGGIKVPALYFFTTSPTALRCACTERPTSAAFNSVPAFLAAISCPITIPFWIAPKDRRCVMRFSFARRPRAFAGRPNFAMFVDLKWPKTQKYFPKGGENDRKMPKYFTRKPLPSPKRMPMRHSADQKRNNARKNRSGAGKRPKHHAQSHFPSASTGRKIQPRQQNHIFRPEPGPHRFTTAPRQQVTTRKSQVGDRSLVLHFLRDQVNILHAPDCAGCLREHSKKGPPLGGARSVVLRLFAAGAFFAQRAGWGRWVGHAARRDTAHFGLLAGAGTCCARPYPEKVVYPFAAKICFKNIFSEVYSFSLCLFIGRRHSRSPTQSPFSFRHAAILVQ